VGDVFGVRIAGNVTGRKVLGSIEYGCAVAGAKLVLVMGHTRCGAVGAAVDMVCAATTAAEATGCQHIDDVIRDIQLSIEPHECRGVGSLPPAERRSFVDAVARRNVCRVVGEILGQSETLAALVRQGRVLVVGALYDVATGDIEFLADTEGGTGPTPDPT